VFQYADNIQGGPNYSTPAVNLQYIGNSIKFINQVLNSNFS